MNKFAKVCTTALLAIGLSVGGAGVANAVTYDDLSPYMKAQVQRSLQLQKKKVTVAPTFQGYVCQSRYTGGGWVQSCK